MGITVDVKNFTVSIPESKLNDILTTCDDVSKQKSITKKDLQSLLVKLLYISRIIRPARAFLNRMLDTLQNMHDRARVQVSGGFKEDLDWFRAFARNFHGCSTFSIWGSEIHETVFIDASLHGLGVVRGTKFYPTALPPYILSENRIAVYEMINILVSLNEWGHDWVDKHVLLYCDNRAVVDIMNRHKTRVNGLGKILNDILYVIAKFNV